MEKEKSRAVVKHFHSKKWTAAQIEAKLEEVHGNTAPTFETVYFRIKGLPPLVAQKKAFFMNFFKENYKTFSIDHYIILKNTS